MRRFVPIAILSLAVLAPPNVHAQDATAGERVFKIQCGACHSAAPGRNMVGPSLHAIIGRKSGQVDSFRYSPANRDSGLVFDAATLDRYLTDPRAAIPGTTMAYAGLKNPEQRANLIAYLATLK